MILPSYRELPVEESDPLAVAWGFRSYELQSERIRLHCVEAGPREGEPVIFLHGFPEFWFSWRHQLKALSSEYRCIAVDLRGYHRSERPRKLRAYRLGELVQDLEDLRLGLGLSQVTWVAHDWGGALAWTYASDFQERTRRLAVLNMPHPALFRRGLLRLKQLRRSAYVFFFQLRGLPERVLLKNEAAAIEWMFASMLQNPTAMSAADLKPFREAAELPGAMTAMLSYYRNIFRPEAVFKRFRTIQAPVGILWGVEDRALGEELLKDTEKYAPRVSIQRLASCSHWIQQDRPEAVNTWLREWLRNTEN